MALSTVATTTHLTNHLETVWSPRMMLDTSEEMKIANHFLTEDDLEVEKVANQLVVRKVGTATVNKVAGTTALDAEALTWEADTEDRQTFSPQFAYTAMAVSKQVETRLLAFPAYDKAKRQQFLRAMAEQIDLDAGDLGDNLSVSVTDVNLSAALIRNALGTLRTNAEREYSTGGPKLAYLRIHPSQQQHLYGIAEINNAEMRGDTSNPNVTGVLVKAWGADVDITGNIVSSSGKRHNMLYIKEAFVRAYNAEPQLQDVQKHGLATLLTGFCDYIVGELYDNYAVDIQTDA